MKPSFAEKVEEFVRRLSLVQFESLVKFTGTSAKAIRNERVERLRSLSFQAGYLAAFMVIWDRLHPAASQDESAHLRELATAYNVGFWKDEKDIQRWGSRKSFPARRKIQFAYADVAVGYFERL
jgi:hypothetical protein